MTIRLIALMSFVLAITLAAFAFLMARYQQGVISEVEELASEIGKATLKTLDSGHLDAGYWVTETIVQEGDGTATRRRVVRAERMLAPGETAPGSTGPAADGSLPFGEAGTVWFFEDGATPRVERFGGGDQRQAIVELRQLVRDFEGSGEAGTTADTAVTDIEQLHAALAVRLDGIEAEDRPGRGLILRFPAHHVASGGEQTERLTRTADSSFAHDIVFPVSTERLHSLFGSTRQRSLVVFLGVLLLGTAVSTAFAHRFTRPVRELDAGITRLAAGDLEAAVPVRGDDEMGRLGRAFNTMAARLRAGRARERDMARRDKLAALGRLAAGVAHDVRNPLHSIGLTMQHLRETSRPLEDDRAVEFDRALDLMKNEIRRLDELVTDFLRFAREPSNERVVIDPAGVLGEVERLIAREAARREVTVTVTVADDLPELHGDAGAIRSAVLNLVLNGLEATPPGGHIELEAKTEGGRLAVRVRDSGRGIAAEDRERVFDFGFSTRDDGHGLGLTMVHQIVVEGHGGEVSLDSIPGEGTTFTLTFPASGAEEPA